MSFVMSDLTNLFFLAVPETDDDEQVTRAKYFIRDEFLVRIINNDTLLSISGQS